MFSQSRVAFVAVLIVTLVCFGQSTTKQAAAADAETEGKERVLRHAVFFKFKDGVSTENVKGVVESFRALPSKIEEIQEFQWGENVGQSGRDDGLTHCFLLTFKDEKGRAVYLPHADHKEFGDVLQPHLEKVFVIDYWGRPQKKQPKKALKHAVFFKFKDDVPDAAVRAVEDGLAGLPAKIDTIKAFEWGKNNSPEKHDESFTHCFMFTFDSEDGLKKYMDDPAHVTEVNDLKPKVEKVRVMDFWVEGAPATDAR